jgi:hypothetical protein
MCYLTHGKWIAHLKQDAKIPTFKIPPITLSVLRKAQSVTIVSRMISTEEYGSFLFILAANASMRAYALAQCCSTLSIVATTTILSFTYFKTGVPFYWRPP